MARLKIGDARDNLLRRVRRQRLKYITVLPSLVTMLNGVCGFAAIVFASQGVTSQSDYLAGHKMSIPYFAISGYMILLAMFCDMLDGRLARMSKSTSSFGGQLDSLCDVISFGLAPAFLMLKLMEYNLKMEIDLSQGVEAFLLRFVWLVAATYVSCAAIRLARFNVENEEDESAHMSFMGLPSPAAAGVIVSLVLLEQEALPDLAEHSAYLHQIADDAILWLLPILALAAAVLMVSRIRYPHIVNQYIRGKKPFAHLVRVLLLLALIVWSRQVAFVLIFLGFAASGFVKWTYMRLTRHKQHLIPAVQGTMPTAGKGGPNEENKN